MVSGENPTRLEGAGRFNSGAESAMNLGFRRKYHRRIQRGTGRPVSLRHDSELEAPRGTIRQRRLVVMVSTILTSILPTDDSKRPGDTGTM
jgi:hypothetical protein